MKPYSPMPPFETTTMSASTSPSMGSNISPRCFRPIMRLRSHDVLCQERSAGQEDRKGFYDWSKGRPAIDLSKATKEWDILHIVALLVNEATKVLEEGVADDPKVIDLAMTNGGGAAEGPFLSAQKIGYAVLVSKLEDIHRAFKLDIFKPTATMKEGKIKV